MKMPKEFQPLLKETCLKKKTKSKTDNCPFLPINNLYGRYIKGRDFFHHVFCQKLDHITQKQMNSMFHIMKAKQIDKNNMYTYISNIMLIKIIVYLNYFSFISSFSGLVMGTRFGNGCNECKA